jgi:hypothetical protein
MGRHSHTDHILIDKRLHSNTTWKSKQALLDASKEGGLEVNTKYTGVYPKVSGLAAWSKNCKWYSSLPLGGVVSLVILVSFVAITLWVPSQQVISKVSVYFIINSVWKLFDELLYVMSHHQNVGQNLDFRSPVKMRESLNTLE